MLSHRDLARQAAQTGFQLEPLEKVARLLELLESLSRHPYLKGRIVLKGGTALNLFVFDVPRLSVDIDLNYIGTVDRETMLAERVTFEKAIQAVCGRLGLSARQAPTEHAGGKWRLGYSSVSGRQGNLELDVNFLLRVPLWPPSLQDSRRIGSFGARGVRVLDLHELAAGKLAALFSRETSRDLFDVGNLLLHESFDWERLRLAFVVYGGVNRRDWRRVAIEDVKGAPGDLSRHLVPVLRADLVPDRRLVEDWTERLVANCRELISNLLPLRPHEVEFLTCLNDGGSVVPELLTRDQALQEAIRSQPGLLWKARNVREHRSKK